MKIKLTSFHKNGKYEMEYYAVKIGGVYEVKRHYDFGVISIKTPSGRELPLFASEFEIVIED